MVLFSEIVLNIASASSILNKKNQRDACPTDLTPRPVMIPILFIH